MWDLKYEINEPIYEVERDSPIYEVERDSQT